MIDKEQIEALIDLEGIARAHGVPIMIIGAGARLLLLDWKYGLPRHRTSKDWDFAARMISWKQYEQFRDALTQGQPAPFRRTAAEHRLQHTSGTLIDLLPFGEIEAPEGTIEWPESHAVMSVIGFREADEHATHVEITPGVTVRVVTIPALVVLKLVAYRDRTRTDDLRDVFFILEQYARHELEDRIFDELSDLLAGGGLAFEQAGAFLLGRDISTQCNPSNRSAVLQILQDLLSKDAGPLASLVLMSLDQEDWEKRFDTITQLFRALKDGLHTGG